VSESMPSRALSQSQLSLPLLHRGKVRDVYRVDQTRLLLVATDRLSAFDVILPTPIPGKGEMLTAISRHWFRRLAGHGLHHLLEQPLETVLPDVEERVSLGDRAMLVRATRALPVEAIVRGYLTGSAWSEYQARGTVWGQPLPFGLREAERLPQPVFTPTTKAVVGEHDQPIDFDGLVARVGGATAEAMRTRSLALYQAAAAEAGARGLLIADSKLEFGVDEQGELVWIDEAFTPDSSRFWRAADWQPGQLPESFDKQFVRDWLQRHGQAGVTPGPELPPEIVAATAARYREAMDVLLSA